MATCHICGAQFFPQSNAWGGETCGDCIAARIELSLMGGLLDAGRKPLMRATTKMPEAEPLPDPQQKGAEV